MPLWSSGVGVNTEADVTLVEQRRAQVLVVQKAVSGMVVIER